MQGKNCFICETNNKIQRQNRVEKDFNRNTFKTKSLWQLSFFLAFSYLYFNNYYFLTFLESITKKIIVNYRQFGYINWPWQDVVMISFFCLIKMLYWSCLIEFHTKEMMIWVYCFEAYGCVNILIMFNRFSYKRNDDLGILFWSFWMC